jgi:hypothetical protein
MSVEKISIGQVFGRLTVIDVASRDNGSHERWLCQCSCENKTKVIVNKYNLLNGGTQSCGCLQKEKASQVGKAGKKYNKYNLSGDYGIGYTLKGEEFYFDLEDYEKIKDYCWRLDSQNYVVASGGFLGLRDVKMHRIIMDAKEDQEIDHAEWNNRDNRKKYLRFATNLENGRNKKKTSRNKSGVVGVNWKKQEKSWISCISVDGEQKVLGLFKNFEDAVKSRLEAEKLYYKEFAPQKHLYRLYGVSENE